MTTARHSVEVYTRGTKAWFTDPHEGWVSATCLDSNITNTDVKLVFAGDNDQKEHIFESSLADIEKTKGAKLPPLRNPPKMEDTDDLTNLSYLNEPAVLNTIRTRYMQHLIYTYSGIVLIAMNPFDRVALYDPDIIQHYSGRRRGELEPHLFAIAEDAYRCMIREQTNQTIVVSGESGAGKTVSAKYIMRYFATADDSDTLGKSKKTEEGMTEVEEQILATNPIMEAFGNAKTTRNDNSSRFGKYIEIQFDDGSNIIGAKIRTYLLERSRLIFQPETERNYHIFYQLCAGAPLSEKKEFELHDYNHFTYLNKSGTGTIPGVDDALEFEVTQRALSTIGLSVQLQWQIFRLLAALLHIGNLKITGRGDAMLTEDDPALLIATKLLGISSTDFRKWIVRKQIVTRSEKIVTNLTPAQAEVVKDSVAKYVYANLFEWLVSVTNDSLSCPNPDKVATFIGVLDIYGFEHFKKNSFEQFCINYANEKLQQQFNQHVFKLEQEEYVREKINWTFIEFSDNQKCIDLIEGKLGILSLLDEESRLPSGSDNGFVQKLYTNFDNKEFNSYFKKPRFASNAFTIAHYALEVQYEAENFIDKNKDTVADEHLALLQSTEFEFLKSVLDKAATNNPAPTPESNKRMSMIARKPTLGSIFKLSLINLMDTIGNTNVHYIRCIKPNESKAAWEFDPNMVLAQLRACGVLETIRISCAGYPSRWTFEEFADRYYALVPFKHWDPKLNTDPRELCSTILDKSIKDEDKYQVGSTKIFFRAGQLAYLEKLRTDRFDACATLLQKNVRRHIYRSRYLCIQQLVIKLQCAARQKAALVHMNTLRKMKAATTIQTHWRRYTARKEYTAKLQHILKLQTAIRVHASHKELQRRKNEKAATQIQRLVRGWFARKRFNAQRQFVIQLQSLVRGRLARKVLVGMKAEARSVTRLKEVSYALENKVVELTQTITGLKDEKKSALDRTVQVEGQMRALMEKYEKLEKKAKGYEQELEKPTVPKEEWETLKEKHVVLEKEMKHSTQQITAKDTQVKNLTETLKKQKEEAEKLRAELDEANKSLKDAPDPTELAELRNQNLALKQQLTHALNTPKQQQVTHEHRGLSPAPKRNPSRSPKPRTQSPMPKTRPTRRNSSSNVAENRPKSSIDNIRKAELLNKHPRPTSVDQYSAALGGAFGQATGRTALEEIDAIIRDSVSLEEEMKEFLIIHLKIPVISLQHPLVKKEVFFPAHIISMCISEMWQSGLIEESERIIFVAMDTIQKQCLSYTGNDAIVPNAFWLSNVHELLSLIIKTEHDLEETIKTKGRVSEWQNFEKLVTSIKFELQCLEDNIFHAWMKELKKRLSKMVIPALIEGQSLPGFVTSDSGRFLNKLLTGSTQTPFTMDDILYLLNKLRNTMKCYYIEQTVYTQVLTELLKLIGVTGFNDLLMRKGFCSWKRAMQIQYNITRVEQWCKDHEFPEGTLQLEHLMQTTKLLQFKKATPEDIDNIYDVCWILTHKQIQKLISNYHVADYENPIQPAILKIVAGRTTNEPSDILLLPAVPLDDTTNPFEIPAPREVKPDQYIPAWSNLKALRRLVELVSNSPESQRTPQLRNTGEVYAPLK